MASLSVSPKYILAIDREPATGVLGPGAINIVFRIPDHYEGVLNSKIRRMHI